MINSFMKSLGAGLSIWEHKEKRKYVDKLMKLKRDYYEESNKDISDDAILDNIEFELELLGIAFSSKVTQKNAANK